MSYTQPEYCAQLTHGISRLREICLGVEERVKLLKMKEFDARVGLLRIREILDEVKELQELMPHVKDYLQPRLIKEPVRGEIYSVGNSEATSPRKFRLVRYMEALSPINAGWQNCFEIEFLDDPLDYFEQAKSQGETELRNDYDLEKTFYPPWLARQDAQRDLKMFVPVAGEKCLLNDLRGRNESVIFREIRISESGAVRKIVVEHSGPFPEYEGRRNLDEWPLELVAYRDAWRLKPLPKDGSKQRS